MKRFVVLVSIVLVTILALRGMELGERRGATQELSQELPASATRTLDPAEAVTAAQRSTHVAAPRSAARTFVREPALESKAERAKILGEAAVLTAALRRELQRLYADEELIARQRERILRHDLAVDRSAPRPERVGSYTFAHVNGSLPAEGEAERMDAVRYLSEALRWKDNPARDIVAEEVERVLLEDSLEDSLHPGVRRGMMGDKIELYSILAREFPGQADSLVSRATSTRVAKLLALARRYSEAGYSYDGVGQPRDRRSADLAR